MKCNHKTIRQAIRFPGSYEEREWCPNCGLVCKVSVYAPDGADWKLDHIEDRIEGKIYRYVDGVLQSVGGVKD